MSRSRNEAIYNMAMTTAGHSNEVIQSTKKSKKSEQCGISLHLDVQRPHIISNLCENINNKPESPLPTNDINEDEWTVLNNLLGDDETPMPSPPAQDLTQFQSSTSKEDNPNMVEQTHLQETPKDEITNVVEKTNLHKTPEDDIPNVVEQTHLQETPEDGIPDVLEQTNLLETPEDDIINVAEQTHLNKIPEDDIPKLVEQIHLQETPEDDIPNVLEQTNLHETPEDDFPNEVHNTPQTSESSLDSVFSSTNTPTSAKRKSTFKRDEGAKRKRHMEQWIDVKRKKLRNTGKEYQSRKGIVMAERKMGPICPNTCKIKCQEKFRNEVRQKIFDNFWKLGEHSKQWEYIDKFIQRHSKKRITKEGPSRRNYTTMYFLPLPSENTENTYEKVKVCLKTFCSTLSITDKFIRTAIKKCNSEGSIVSDERGKHTNHPTKIPAMKQSVCDHVQSFQPVESHYTRKDSSKLYLDGSLSFAKMFELYKTWDQLDKYDAKAETLRQYRDIVNNNMNISFFVPKKDICDKCHSFSNETNPTDDQVRGYNKHTANKNSAREMKAIDKLTAQSSSSRIVCATFDFQKILNIPHGDVGLFYYKRKLSMYNFTVFDADKKEGVCFMWTECTAKRGANEVSSCLMLFVTERVRAGAHEFRFWSDNCSGQNRNRIVYTAYMYLAKLLKIDIIHRFLEQGHTQSEGDSVHALIERESKGKMVYTPDQWYTLVRWAKTSGKPYIVEEVSQDEVFDFKPLMESRNWKKTTTNGTVKWNQIKEVHVKKAEPNSIYFKYSFDEEYQCLNTVVETRRGKKNFITANTELNTLYSNIIPVQSDKYKDLQSLCSSNVIPKQYHKFYVDLKHEERQAQPLEEDE